MHGCRYGEETRFRKRSSCTDTDTGAKGFFVNVVIIQIYIYENKTHVRDESGSADKLPLIHFSALNSEVWKIYHCAGGPSGITIYKIGLSYH